MHTSHIFIATQILCICFELLLGHHMRETSFKIVRHMILVSGTSFDLLLICATSCNIHNSIKKLL